MRTLKIFKALVVILTLILFAWLALTIYVERTGPEKIIHFVGNSGKRALVVYDPDPFYNLDEQVCMAFAKGLSDSGIQTTVASVAAAEKLNTSDFDLHTYCANTYNWRPDCVIKNFVLKQSSPKPVVAITLGAGSTDWSREAFNKIITGKKNKLLHSYSLWLLRPNDETESQKSNTEIAKEKSYSWGLSTAGELK